MSAPQPFIDPRALQGERTLTINQLTRDRFEQAYHDLQRLAAIEHAHAVGDDLDPLMAGCDPIETRDTAAYMLMLAKTYDLLGAEAHSVRVPVRGVFACDPDESCQ